jgi:hypothetical protein
MNSEPSTTPSGKGTTALFALWIFGTGVFYLLRSAFALYHANSSALDALLRGLLHRG